MMTYHAMAMNCRHPGEFCIDRPRGSGDNLLIIFKTNALITIDGNTIAAPPDSAVLYSLGAPQLYQSCGKMYIDHFLHFDCCESDQFHTTSGVPFNQLIYMNDANEVEDILRMISREYVSQSSHKEKYLDILIQMLLLKISDSTRKSNSPFEKNPHISRLNAMRAEMYSNAGQFGSVNEIANRLNLSPSYFQQLYHAQFGVSCYEDLLTARMKTAQYYLHNTMLTVKEIAMLCGYENDICFMRTFKKRTGLTPMEYRSDFSTHQ